MAGLSQALEEDPKSPALLRARGQILLDQKDYPGATESARQAWDYSNHTDMEAWAILKMSEGRTASVGAAPDAAPKVLPQPSAAAVRADDAGKPYRLAIKSGAMPSEVPALTGVKPAAPGLWGRAADGLILRGSDWIASADAAGENGFSGVGKFASKGVGKGLVAAGGLMDALPVAVDWTLDKDRRLLSGDITAVADVSRGAYTLGKTAVVGFAQDTRVAANDWAGLLTLKQPTTYQALKATAHTEAILANFVPVGFAAREAGVAVETAEVVGVNASRRALAKVSLLVGARPGRRGRRTNRARGGGAWDCAFHGRSD